MARIWSFCLLLAVLLVISPLSFCQTEPSNTPRTREIINESSEQVYQEALTHLRKLRPKSFSANNHGITHYILDLVKSFFFYQPSEVISSGSHSNGRKLTGSLHTGVELLKTAAKAGNPDAIYTLADMNFFGNYTYPRDFSEAFRGYSKLAALNGNASAQFMVGFFYSTGLAKVVEKDQAKAILYYTSAADQGNERAQMAMGYIHTIGIGAPKDCYTSVKYYRSVAEKGLAYIQSGPPGGYHLRKTVDSIADEDGGIYGDGASVSSAGSNSRQSSPNSDANASPDDVLEYLDLMSKKGDLSATLTLGRMHYEGRKGLNQDYLAAKEYFLEVARTYWSKGGKVKLDVSPSTEKLAARAAGCLGRMFVRGEGMEPSIEIARTWFKRGVSSGDSMSQYFLGLMYLNGQGVSKDAKRASELFSASADQGFSWAQVSLGTMFLDQGDIQVAAKYFELAARVGNVDAFYYLGEITYSGLLGEESCDMANHYFKSFSERAEGIMSSFIEANEANDAGDLDLAVLDYMLAAEQGFEVAQANVAFLVDRQTRTSLSARLLSAVSALKSLIPKEISLPISTETAFLYWSRSARQFNIDSLLKMGDYYLEGKGVSSPDQDKAAACYQAAAEKLLSGQALWNIGWMYENGIGGMEQDFHLAKRYYDQALEINKESYLAVKLALIKLRMRSRWNEWTRGSAKSIQDERVHRRPFSFQEWLSSFLEADAALHAQGDGDTDAADDWDPIGHFADMTDAELWDEALSGLVESAAIIGLAIVLAILVIYRRQRGEQRRRVEQFQRGQNNVTADQGGNAAQTIPQPEQNDEDDRGLFPRPGDEDLMNWAVGGVGH